MRKLAAGQTQSEWDADGVGASAVPAAEADAVASGLVARVRWLMLISGLTTLVGIAAVVGVIGYRVYRAAGTNAAATADGIITLPKGARVIATTVSEGQIAVTLEVAGATEVRTFDRKTLKQTGRIRFATEP
jgi:hypothetical protein